MTDINIWGFTFHKEWLTSDQERYLTGLPAKTPLVQWVWEEMDKVWEQFGLDNRNKLSYDELSGYYGHPVWLMNGIFTAVDPESISHRNAIAQYLQKHNIESVIEYGGGFSELARVIVNSIKDIEVFVLEPYPSRVALELNRLQGRIQFISTMEGYQYDAAVAQDVLEHVEDPIKIAYDMASSVSDQGILIFANCFYPVIKCHLPSTFYLRHTFPIVMRALGLQYLGNLDKAPHIQVYKKNGAVNLAKARVAERLVKVVGPVINGVRNSISYIKKLWSF